MYFRFNFFSKNKDEPLKQALKENIRKYQLQYTLILYLYYRFINKHSTLERIKHI